ncbi:MAG: arsenic resistance N-acetyltransferase ArsN2 [Bacillota bacterium]
MTNWTVREATPEDRQAVLRLLESVGLSREGISPSLRGFLVATDGAQIVGCVGLESYGSVGLLRSLAVSEDMRGQGLGQLLVCEVLNKAKQNGVFEVYLLTTTARGFFDRLGFVKVERDCIPAALAQSVQVKRTCPLSATVMTKATS